MILEQLLEQINTDFGTDFKALDNTCTLAFDEIVVTIMEIPEKDTLFLTGNVGEIPPYPPENLYAGLLMANHHFENTKGASFSLDPETKEVHLSIALESKNLSYERFREELESFVHTFETWNSIITNYTGGDHEDNENEKENGENESINPLSMGSFLRV